MIRRFFKPAFSGDYRIDADPESADRSVLSIENATALEADILAKFFQTAARKSWVDAVPTIPLEGTLAVTLRAPVSEAAVDLVTAGGGSRPGTLVAVRSTAGVVTVTEVLAEAKKEMEKPAAEVAVEVRRPTPCCPSPEPGPEEVRASEVLRAFCTAEQWADWTQRGYVRCIGGYTGHQYRIVHRHNPIAVRQGRICADLDDQAVLHFHDSLLPPPEEVLSAMLVLQHREDWLRNDSTCLGSHFTDVFANPLGPPAVDGVESASFMRQIGSLVTGRLPSRHFGASFALA